MSGGCEGDDAARRAADAQQAAVKRIAEEAAKKLAQQRKQDLNRALGDEQAVVRQTPSPMDALVLANGLVAPSPLDIARNAREFSHLTQQLVRAKGGSGGYA